MTRRERAESFGQYLAETLLLTPPSTNPSATLGMTLTVYGCRWDKAGVTMVAVGALCLVGSRLRGRRWDEAALVRRGFGVCSEPPRRRALWVSPDSRSKERGCEERGIEVLSDDQLSNPGRPRAQSQHWSISDHTRLSRPLRLWGTDSLRSRGLAALNAREPTLSFGQGRSCRAIADSSWACGPQAVQPTHKEG